MHQYLVQKKRRKNKAAAKAATASAKAVAAKQDRQLFELMVPGKRCGGFCLLCMSVVCSLEIFKRNEAKQNQHSAN